MPSSRDRSNSSPTKTRRKSKQDNMFGPYVLLYTIGEGEFAKVKYGIHSESGEEAAIKLIRKENVDGEKLSKIKREIAVLKTLAHPYIVSLTEVIETQNYIGIVLEYASGGELFDYILAHRYLKEREACRLFAQLICGVDYMHRNKIIHRDLKLENLLLDRNRNVIVTDFGFANQFGKHGDDLMSTSCGSPCYAAPELVVSDGMYAGSAVDIWSCGVILYAMLAGYLPFDDDPENPEGDNINLLYKYILSTPLSFPDYIGSDARDLLRRMLVPDPLKRCKIKDIMAHRWMAPYKGLFEEFRLQAKVSFATGVPPPLDDQKVNDSMAKTRRHTMHIEASPKMLDASLNKHKIPIPLPDPIPPRPEPIVIATPSSTEPSPMEHFMGHEHAIPNGKIMDIPEHQALDPFNPNEIVAPSHSHTQQPLDPFDPNTTVMFEVTSPKRASSKRSQTTSTIPSKTKTRPISMQVPSTQHSNQVQPGSPKMAVTSNSTQSPKGKPNRPMSVNVSPNWPEASSSPASPAPAPAKRSNRYDSRKALSAVLDGGSVPGLGLEDEGSAPQRKSTLSPTGTTARRITDWIKRKSIVLKGGMLPPELYAHDSPNPRNSYLGPRPDNESYKLRHHRGAVDQFALTSKPPPQVFSEIKITLQDMGFLVDKQYDFKLKLTRPGRPAPGINPKPQRKFTLHTIKDFITRKPRSSQPTSAQPTPTPQAIISVPDQLYGDLSIDNGDEVKIAVELCKIKNFPNLYILDVKRVKGNIWSYKFLYHLVLDKLQLNAQGNYLSNS